jgi:hypothetical protein
VLRDVLDVDDLGELLETAPGRGVLVEQGTDGVGDLAAPAVADGDVHEQPVGVAGGLLGGLEPCGRGRRQQVECAHRVHPPVPLGRERVDRALDDREEVLQLLRGPAGQVVAREQPQRDHLDADLLAPAEHRTDVVGAGLVAVSGPQAHRLGPAAVAVEHHPDVLGRVVGHPAQDPCLVDGVDDLSQATLPVRHVHDGNEPIG